MRYQENLLLSRAPYGCAGHLLEKCVVPEEIATKFEVFASYKIDYISRLIRRLAWEFI